MADFKITRNDELMHYRTKGSKNGVRLYQNPDGSLTPLGERHYRDMYGYGELDNSVRKAIDDPGLRRVRSGQIFKDTPYVRISGKSLSPYKSAGSTQSASGGKQTGSASTSSKNASPEYLEELNYNSQKNEYPSNGKSNTPQQKESTRNESTLKKAYNDASKWVVDRADDVKKGVTDAYNSASKAVVDTADKVKKGATDAYNSASKAVVDAADEARYAAERAYNSASNAVADAARAVNDVKENFGPGVADVANAVKEWVTTAADDVKKTAGEAFDAGKEWVEQAGKDVGDFVDSAVSDVAKAVDDAKNGVVDAANTVGKAAQDGWNWVKGLFGGGDDYGKDENKDRSNHSSSSHKM